MEKIAPLPFPEMGLDVADAQSAQRPGTTPDAQNVRTLDPTTDRARGARRPGLSKVIEPIGG